MFVAIEGIDGSGKATQAQLLVDRCRGVGLQFTKLAFPQYGKTPFAEAISEYLNGAYGGVGEVHPKLVSVLFAADRYAARDAILASIGNVDVVVADRYVASNLAHQGAKLKEGERDAFIDWLCSIEYGVFGLPHADLTLFLDLPLATAGRLVQAKGDRSPDQVQKEGEQKGYTNLAEDIHEADKEYLAACQSVYHRLLTRQVGGRWESVPCVDSEGELRDPNDISEDIWSRVSGLLWAFGII